MYYAIGGVHFITSNFERKKKSLNEIIMTNAWLPNFLPVHTTNFTRHSNGSNYLVVQLSVSSQLPPKFPIPLMCAKKKSIHQNDDCRCHSARRGDKHGQPKTRDHHHRRSSCSNLNFHSAMVDLRSSSTCRRGGQTAINPSINGCIKSTLIRNITSLNCENNIYRLLNHNIHSLGDRQLCS